MFCLISLFCGVIFGLGLALSQMINPAKVLNFLDLTGQWDATLALVFVGALAVALPAYQWVMRRRRSPVVAREFHIPDDRAITPSLLGGSALFGIGWGLAGFCPGPGLAALATLSAGAFVFVAALFLGIASYRFLIDR